MSLYYSHGGIDIHLGDCREILPTLPKCDLLLTDPPYGIGFAAQPTRYQRTNGMNAVDWDDLRAENVDFLLVGEAQIIWGGNYFRLPVSRGWLCWRKIDAPPSMGAFELAWTNQDVNARMIAIPHVGHREFCPHPTQKPLALMKWCISLFPDAKTVLDPYCGSGTTLVAAKAMGLTAIGIELHEPYAEICAKRLSQEVFDFTGAR
jgi:DNA modification methylase